MALDGLLPGEDAGVLVAGQRKVSDIAATTVGRQVPQWIRDMAINVSEDVAPLAAMLDRLKKPKIVKNPLYNHLEKDILPRWVEVDSFTVDGDGVAPVLASGHGKRLKVKDLLYVPRTDEIMQVTAISTDTLTVTRGFGSSSATTLLVGEDIQIASSAHLEGSASPDGISSEPTIYQNYTQTAKVAVDLSGRALVIESVGGPEFADKVKDASRKMREEQETALFHGARNTSDPTATGGLDYYITTNNTDVGGALTEATWNTLIKKFRHRNQTGSNHVVFCGELVLDAVDGFARDNIRYRPEDKMLGIAVTKSQNAHGTINMAKHGGMTINPDVSGQCYFLNLDLINKVELANRGFMYKTNVQTPDVDGRKDQFISDFGLWLGSQKQHQRVSGVTG